VATNSIHLFARHSSECEHVFNNYLWPLGGIAFCEKSLTQRRRDAKGDVTGGRGFMGFVRISLICVGNRGAGGSISVHETYGPVSRHFADHDFSTDEVLT
jgi:hypothetical protein